MIDDAVATRWRRLGAPPRARALRRLTASSVARRDELASVFSAHFRLSEAHCAHFELAAVAAAVDELAQIAPRALDRAPARRWFFGEPVSRRDEVPDTRVVLAHPLASPAAVLAWCSTALVAGSAVTLRCEPAVEPAYRAWWSCVDEEDAPPIELVATAALDASSDAVPSAISQAGALAPSVAWVDDSAQLDRYAALVARAARYANGDRRGALRWVFARESTARALFEALSARAGEDRVRCVFAPSVDDPATITDALVFEPCADEHTFVARARERGPLAYACGIGADSQRVRSLALRSGADAVFVNSGPGDALGGLLRVDFEPVQWLSIATRAVSIAHGPPPSIARIEPSRKAWLRRLVGITLSRYGIGGVVDDLW